MAGLVPATHVFGPAGLWSSGKRILSLACAVTSDKAQQRGRGAKDVDGRHKAGHDGTAQPVVRPNALAVAVGSLAIARR
jgi:hypothetical protein